MKKYFLILGLFFILNSELLAKIKVVTTIPDLAWLIKEAAGDLVDVESLLTGVEDPHYVDAIPSYILKASNADLLCQVGLALEIGWLPKVLEKSGHSLVQQGGKGFCDASSKIKRRQTINSPVNRSMGDLHPLGNPHYSLSPIDMIDALKAIVSKLIEADTENVEHYIILQIQLEKKLKLLHSTINKKFDDAFGKGERPLVIEYHREFIYYADAYGFTSYGTIEKVPGVPPSAGRLAEIGIRAKHSKVKLALAIEYHPRAPIEKFKEISGVPVAIVPGFVQPNGKIDDYIKLQHYIADKIIETTSK